MSANSDVWVIVSLALLPGAFAIAIFWVSQVSPVARHLLCYQGLAGPFFVPFAVLFGLFAAFLANDIWIRAQDRSNELEQSFERETSAVRSLQRIAVGLEDNGTALQAALVEYAGKAGFNGGAGSDQQNADAVDASLQKVVNEILSPQLSGLSYAAAKQQMLALSDTIERSRAERAASTLYESDIFKWMGMIVLGFLTQAAIAMVHIENRKAQAAGLILFSLSFSIVLLIVAISEQSVFDTMSGHTVILTQVTG